MKKRKKISERKRICILVTALTTSIVLYSCSKNDIKNNLVQPENGITQYSVLVTTSGNKANLEGFDSGRNAQEATLGFSAGIMQPDGFATSAFVDLRDTTSVGSIGYDNDDFLAHDSLWSYTQDKVDSFHIGMGNFADQYPDEGIFINQPLVNIRLQIFVRATNKRLLDTTFKCSVLNMGTGPYYNYQPFYFKVNG